MRATFEIDELVLIGFDASSRYRIADALEHELAAAWRARGAGSVATRDRARAGASITIPPGIAPGALGRGIAGEIMRALASPAEDTS
jgi:hypothetical protein